MTNKTMIEGRVKAYRMMQYFGAGSTLVCAALLYMFMPDKDLGKVIAGVLALFAISEFFVFRSLADKTAAKL